MFTVEKTNGAARIGTLRTRHGDLPTPFFMPDATRASVRGLTTQQLTDVGIHPMVVNTYHLYLQPGMELITAAGGVHSLMNWEGPLLSDSGGYQVFSLIHKNPRLGRITADGAEFRSVRDGSTHLLTPEKAIQIQFDLGVDMMVVLDDPRPNDAPRADIAAAVERTITWAGRCKVEYEKQVRERGFTEENRPLLFGVVQGGLFDDLRKRCAEGLIAIGFDGYGFGARHVDANGVFMADMLRYTAELLPEDKPRFALGIGNPSDIMKCYAVGWDMFDCVIPTREGRHGRAFVWNRQGEISLSTSLCEALQAGNSQEPESLYSTLNITNKQYRLDFSPIDAECSCYCCQNYSKAYLQHLFRAQEPLGAQMLSLHNLRFYMELMQLLKGQISRV